MPQTSQRVWKRLWWSPNWLRWWKVPKRHFTAARLLVLTCKLHQLVLTCKSFSVHVRTCAECTVLQKLRNTCRLPRLVQIFLFACMYLPLHTMHIAQCLANTLENLQTPPGSVTVKKYLSGQCRASTLQLAPALLIKSLWLGSSHAGIQTLISWSQDHQALFGFTFAKRDHCRARPNSYTARLFGEKEAATGFKIAQESWNLCHHSVMSILSSLPLFLSLCVSPSLFLFLCVSLCPFLWFVVLVSLCFCPCPIFLLIPVSNLEGGSPEQCRALGWLPWMPELPNIAAKNLVAARSFH